MKKEHIRGILLALVIAIPAWLLGKQFPIIGGPVFGILLGMLLAGINRPSTLEPGIAFTGKKILQYAIILLGFEMNLFNVLAVFIFPFLGHLMNMSDLGFGMWAGTAVNDTSSVVAAGYSYSEEAGGLATIVKLTRALMIVPVCLIFALLMAREKANTGAGFNFRKIFPWFILWFVVASIVNTTGILPEALSQTLGTCGKFAIVMAMTAIGLNTRLGELVKHGLMVIFSLTFLRKSL
ncbi:hypothetical protein SELR_pSRC101800 (plasmid) [Selenomonas ruminantium subsp. lactilytica TAM6421]|uniref:Sulfate exporter family transporter n=1 Tax=Selenomonas ruminantium subsp. lactilytica (strain NBRC 103574 / TAM6421) TaxID=927704 RepID=I0GW50_SELRL|nr:putative sulfate exporter family transporter [Selenomonas ruminantium]BAL84987.1 hypothetical protein SELR_pSRC101800 [Selenomonas ruminantium subsp. lactilytica TAM6421]